MKIKTLRSASFFCTYGAIALIIGTMTSAKAQNTVPAIDQSVLNGLFSPTASERFFKEGRRNIEREVKILTNPELYKPEDILLNNGIDKKTIEQLDEKNPILNFPEESPQL